MANTYDIEKSQALKKFPVKENEDEKPVEKSADEVEKCNQAMAGKKKKIGEIVKAWEADGRPVEFFKYFAKADKELLKEMGVTPDLWGHYMVNFVKSINKGNPVWDEMSSEMIEKMWPPKGGFPPKKEEGEKPEAKEDEKQEDEKPEKKEDEKPEKKE